MAVPALNLFCCGRDCVLPCDIDLDKVDITKSGLFERSNGLTPTFRVARALQHGASSAAEITRDFQANAFISSGHQCDPLCGCHMTCIPPVAMTELPGFRPRKNVPSHPCGKNKYAARMGHPHRYNNKRSET